MLWVLAGFAFVSVFVFTTSKPDLDKFLLDNTDLLALALGEQITDPRFTGVTNTDDAFSIGAEAAVPNGPRPTRVDLVSPSTSIELNSGVFVFARSDEGAFDADDRTVSLSGGAIVTSTDGYRIDADRMTLNLEESRFSAENSISVQAQNSEIMAGSLVIERKETDSSKNYFVLRFSDGVRLTYSPEPGAE